jgi:hypothetical protein
MPQSVQLQVHAGEPGIAVMLFTTPPEDDSQRRPFLDKALDEWKLQHPHLGVDHVESIERDGKVFGLSFYFSLKTPTPLTVKVEPELQARYGREYIEAISADAGKFLMDQRLRNDLVAMINRREIAILVERRIPRATMLRLDEVRPLLTGKQKKDLAEWLNGGEFGYFIAPLK